MTVSLTINQDQLTYHALFSRPVFSFLDNRSRVFEGLLTTFSEYDVGVTNISIEGVFSNPSSFGINIGLGSFGLFRVRYDRLEWFATDFDDEVIEGFGNLLQRAANWLRSEIDGFSFKSHLLQYLCHAKLLEGDAKEFLLTLPRQFDPDFGENLGNGLILNWRDEELGGRSQLLVDHSLVVTGGLAIQMLAVIDGDALDYAKMQERGWNIFDQALKKIGLEVEEEVDFDEDQD